MHEVQSLYCSVLALRKRKARLVDLSVLVLSLKTVWAPEVDLL